MEQIKKSIQIDMNDYGLIGVIDMRKPSLRRQNEFKNSISKYFDFIDGEKKLKPMAPIGDLELLMTLQYVFRAPFLPTIESFLEYTDQIDPDDANDLMARMEAAARELMAFSPFAQSQPQGTESSE